MSAPNDVCEHCGGIGSVEKIGVSGMDYGDRVECSCVRAPNAPHPQPRERDAFERWMVFVPEIGWEHCYDTQERAERASRMWSGKDGFSTVIAHLVELQPHEVIVAKETSAPDGAIDEATVNLIAEIIADGGYGRGFFKAINEGNQEAFRNIARAVIAALRGQEAGR